MRRCLYISSLLLLLTLCVELCAAYSSGVVKDSSRLVCVLDDDDVEVKEGVLRDHSLPECDTLSLNGPFLFAVWARTELILPLTGNEIIQIHSRVRWHRWLCKESC